MVGGKGIGGGVSTRGGRENGAQRRNPNITLTQLGQHLG